MLLQRALYNVFKQTLSNGYRWAASATSPGAFEANLLTTGIPEEVSIQMPQTCLIKAAVWVPSKPCVARITWEITKKNLQIIGDFKIESFCQIKKKKTPGSVNGNIL